MFIALWFCLQYLINKKGLLLLGYICFATLAVLSKIPAGIYFVLLIPLLFSRKISLKPKIIISIATLIPLMTTYYWYFIWNVHLSDMYGTWYNLGMSLKDGFYDISAHVSQVLNNFYFNSFVGFSFFILSIWGLFCSIKNKNKILLTIVSSVFAIFVVHVFKSGFFFYHHNYYIIPFVPILALLAGYGLSFIKRQALYIPILTFCIFESVINQQHDFVLPDREKYKLQLPILADQTSHLNDKIVINGNDNPQMLYLSHRKG
jgi:4-amino-4-deoxy-L-arabinose transferase-like glycosyltransferase